MATDLVIPEPATAHRTHLASQMEINQLRVHKLDIKQKSVSEIQFKEADTDFVRYINEVLADVVESKKGRRFNFISDTAEMHTLIARSVYEGKFHDSVERSAHRLLAEEMTAQAKIAHMGTEIQKGILIHAVVRRDNQDMFVICKADDISYIDEKDLKLANGFPVKKKIFKSVLVVFDSDRQPIRVDVYDSANHLSFYWWSAYLELDPLLDNAQNTAKAFEALDNMVFSTIKKESLADHFYLRNALITAMKGETAFDMDSYADEVLARYQPVNPDLDMKKIAEKARVLPEKFGFDSTFELEGKAITAKVRQVVPLTENIDLTIKDKIDTRDMIIPVLGKDKTKYIQIRSSVGYDTFIQNKRD